MPTLHQIVVRPVVTEKSSAAYQTRKEYTFEVHPEANKYQIRDALQKLFGVHGHRRAHHADAAARGHPGPHPRDDGPLEEGDRHAQGRRLDRRVRGLR